jgi:hypothetical protein
MVRQYLIYNKQILKLSLTVSLLLTILIAPLTPNSITISRVIYSFLFTFITGGYLLGVFYYELARNREYYFFYNQGISKLQLLLASYIIHLLLSLPLFIIAIYAKHS